MNDRSVWLRHVRNVCAVAAGLLASTLLLLALSASPVAASGSRPDTHVPEGTIVGGTITTDTTWSLAGSPYTVDSQHVTVVDKVTLTIDPGVIVQFKAGLKLWVNGTLHAVGTPTQPITFTRAAASAWGGIQIGGGTVLTDSAASQISYATIEGGGNPLLEIYHTGATLDHLTLRNGSGGGLRIGTVPAGATVTFDNGTVTGNSGDGVFVTQGRALLSNLAIANNSGDGIEFSTAPDSQLLNSSIQNNNGHGIHTSGDRLLFDGLTVTGNTGHGVYMQTGGEGSTLRNATVQGNGVAARLHPNINLENVTWTGNTRSEIEWINGVITRSRTWARLPEISTYRVVSHVTVQDNTTLTVDPGVTVGIEPGMDLWVNGALWAVGTPAQPITFTRPAGTTQPWGDIQIGGGSVVTDSDASRLSYATLEGGGSNIQMLYLLNSAPRFDHLTLRNSGYRGLYVSNVVQSPSISWDTGTVTGSGGDGIYAYGATIDFNNLDITGNVGNGIVLGSTDDCRLLNSNIQGNGGDGIHTSSVDRLLLQGLTIGGNTGYGVYMQDSANSRGVGGILRDTTVQGNGVAARLHPDTLLENVTWTGNTRSEIEWTYGQISGDRTWAHLPEISTYRVLGNVIAPDNTTLTVEPGVTVQLDANVSLDGVGGFSAVGTPTQPITFTRIPGLTSPWGAIVIGGGNVLHDSDASRVSYAIIEGGGRGPGAQAGEQVHIYYSSATLDHVTVRDGTGMGIKVTPWADTRVTLDTVAVINNAGVAISHVQPGPSLTYRSLTLQGNGTDAVLMASGTIRTVYQWDLADAGVPVRASTFHLSSGGILSLMQGSQLEFTPGAQVEVWSGSGLYALGAPEAPITLTATVAQPGGWKGIWQHPDSRLILRNSNVEYGGAGGEPALKMDAPRTAALIGSRVTRAAGDGVLVNYAKPPVLGYNDISGNGFGVRNARTDVEVDARNVWWGDPSGPYHPTLNPGGLGNAVSDHVQFQPWLTAPPPPAPRSAGLTMLVSGPERAMPGSRVTYGLLFANDTAQTLSGSIVVADLPRDGEYGGGSPGAQSWGQRRQVFWRVKPLAPGQAQAFALPVRYSWGIPPGTLEKTLGGATGIAGVPSVFNAADYQNYSAEQLTGTQALTQAEIDAELAASPGLNQLYQGALAQGYLRAGGYRMSYVAAQPLLRLFLLDFPNRRTMILQQRGTRVLATVTSPGAVTLSDTSGGDRYDLATRQHNFFGAWARPARRLNAVFGPAEDPNFGNCMYNCIMGQIPEWLFSYLSGKAEIALGVKDCLVAQGTMDEVDAAKCGASIQDKLPLAGEVIDASKCAHDCNADPTSSYCQEDKITCGCTGFEVFGMCWGQDVALTYICDKETGLLGLPKWGTGCNSNINSPIEKCVEGKGCVACDANGEPQQARAEPEVVAPTACTGEGGTCSTQPTQIVVPKDPNAKYGPEGDLVPGQVVTYTITYENEGAGTAYGVYVVDKLSEYFDESTLALTGDTIFAARTREIFWYVGELAPKGQEGSKGSLTFGVRLKSDLPSGTVIYNRATVHFPSAPEVTPTNAVVNVIAPLAAVPQHVETPGAGVAIHLTGREASNAPLTFAIAQKPLYGDLTGSPPDVIYTPMSGFVGQDSFSFTASNAVTVSLPADVDILVKPSPNDVEAPTVTWVNPANGAHGVAVSGSALFTGTLGPVYGPLLMAEFSESMDASTLTSDTVRLSDGAGHAVPLDAVYYPATRKVVLMPLEPLLEQERYTARITPAVADAAGNHLAGYTWSFKTGPSQNLYLPLLVR